MRQNENRFEMCPIPFFTEPYLKYDQYNLTCEKQIYQKIVQRLLNTCIQMKCTITTPKHW